MSSNESLVDPSLSSNSFISPLIKCYVTKPSSFIYMAYRCTFILLLLPLCIFIIHQWRTNLSSSSAAPMSHSDSFTYNMVAMEMIGVFGSVLVICGINTDQIKVFLVGFFLLYITWFGQMFFHVLTCVERYLAVVHPITYLSLRKQRGTRIRNISIACIWMLCFAGTVLVMQDNVLIILYFCISIPSLAIVSFCSVSVLCVLIGPGPGEQGGARNRVDQSKLKAFYTIMVILGVLVVRFACNLAWAVLNVVQTDADCLVMTAGIWSFLPSSLVLPLLFLLRRGKLVCWKKNIQ